MTKKLHTALLQVDLHWENPAENRRLFDQEIEKLSEKVELIILPEMFTTGFSMNAENLAEEINGPSLQWMQETAKTRNTAVTGSIIITENGKFYNRLYFVYPGGDFKIYDKRHTFTLAKEDKTYTAGNERLLLEYKGWKICPLICYDLRFPVWARNTVNYDLLIYVANWPQKRISAWDALLKARAIENMTFCIGVNRTGKDGGGFDYNGHTCVYDALGENMSVLNVEKPFAREITLNKIHLEETRDKFKFLLDRDDFHFAEGPVSGF